MMLRPLRMMGTLVIAGTLASGAQSAAGDQQRILASIARPSSISGYNGWLAWSTFDANAGVFRLTVWNGGVPSTPAIAASKTAFDVDLGPDQRGRPTAVYSRCPTASTATRRARSCDVFALDLASGRERQIGCCRLASFDEIRPSLWRGRVAFARARRGGSKFEMRVGAMADLSAPRTQSVRGLRLPSGTGGPSRLDLYGTRLVFRWESVRSDCRTEVQSGDARGEQIWLSDLSASKSQLLSSGCFGDPRVAVKSPTLGTRGLVAVTIDLRNASPLARVSWGIGRLSTSKHPATVTPLPYPKVCPESVAQTGARFAMIAPQAGCQYVPGDAAYDVVLLG